MSDGEKLIEIADEFLCPRRLMLYEDGTPWTDGEIATIALAVRFRSRPDLCLRAMVEKWDRFQIVRELH